MPDENLLEFQFMKPTISPASRQVYYQGIPLWIALLCVCSLLISCDKGELSFDPSGFYKTSLYIDGDFTELSPIDANEIRTLLLKYEDRMKTVSTTYPSPLYSLKLQGEKDGEPIEARIFVGTNWIGDSHCLTSLTDEDATMLNGIVARYTNNKIIIEQTSILGLP